MDAPPLRMEGKALVYRRYLPAFSRDADRMGEAAWCEFIRHSIWRGAERIPLRLIEDHVCLYIRRMVHLTPGLHDAAEIPLNPAVLAETWADVTGSLMAQLGDAKAVLAGAWDLGTSDSSRT